MKRLDRTRSPEPRCLQHLPPNAHEWDDFSYSEKSEIRYCLNKVQRGGFCAYCERRIDIQNSKKCIIEHFFPRSSHSALVFQWDNLFLSCLSGGQKNSSAMRDKSCGSYKDDSKNRHKNEAILKPDIDETEKYFYYERFGRIEVAKYAPNRLKAESTINRLNLNSLKLVQSRREVHKYVSDYFQENNCRMDAQDGAFSDEAAFFVAYTIQKKGFPSLVFDLVKKLAGPQMVKKAVEKLQELNPEFYW